MSASGAAPIVSDRELNRTTLSRQLLLERVELPVLEAVDHLVGLQAQVPQNPYVALWSRLAGFEPSVLEQTLLNRETVRMVAMRGTLHLLSARQCRSIRRVTQPVMDAEIARHSEHKSKLVDVEMSPVLQAARNALAEAGSLSNPQLRSSLAEAFPDLDAAALAYACRCYLPLVQVPPRGLWTRSGAVRSAVADNWLDAVPDDEVTIDDLVLRYLVAFGPASNADIAAWSRLTGIAEVTDRLDLRRYRDERGRELLDVPSGVLIAPESQARTVFLPEYDNALLSHKDRRRFVSEETVAGFGRVQGPVHGTALVDGFGAAVWRVERGEGAETARLIVTAVRRLTPAERNDLEDGARELAAFALGVDATVEMKDSRRE